MKSTDQMNCSSSKILIYLSKDTITKFRNEGSFLEIQSVCWEDGSSGKGTVVKPGGLS